MGAYFGDPGQTGDNPSDFLGSLMPLYHEVKNRELQDYAAKGQINQDLEIRRNRMQAMMDPLTGMGRTTNNVISKGLTPANTEIGTVLKDDLSPQDKLKFGLEKSAQDLEKSKITQQGKLGEEKLGIQSAQEKLNVEKNENIHTTKMADMQRKVDETTQRLSLAHDQLTQKTNDANAHIEFNKAQMAATQARHELDIAQRDRALEEQKRYHDAQIADMQKKLDAAAAPKTETTDVNPEGTKKTVTTTKGTNKAFDTSTTYKMIGKDGKPYMISGDKVEQAKKDGLSMPGPGQ